MLTTPFWIEGIGAAVGGLAAAAGAIAAWRAANKSSSAALDARNALALAVRPNVEIELSQWEGEWSPVKARVTAVARPWDQWGAQDLILQFRLASGRAGSKGPLRLEPARPREPGQPPSQPPYIKIELGQPTDTWPPPDGDHVEVRAEYLDDLRVASVPRHRRRRSASLREARRDLVPKSHAHNPYAHPLSDGPGVALV